MTLDDLKRPKSTIAEKIVYGAHQKNLSQVNSVCQIQHHIEFQFQLLQQKVA